MIQIRKISGLLTLLMVAFFLLGGQAAALDKSLTVGKVSGAIGATVAVPITIDDAAGVGGVAFTMTYDPAVFEFQGLAQGGKVITDGSNTTYTTDELKTSLFYQANDEGALASAPTGRLLVAAASADGLTGSNLVILNASFKILSGNGEYPIGLVKTIIKNDAAGYPVPTFIPVFVGTTTKNSSGLYTDTNFPVYPATLVAGSITVNAAKFNIAGTATYGETTNPAAGATVVLKRNTPNGYVEDAQTTVGSTGAYSFTGKPAGTYQVFVISNNPGFYNNQSAVFVVTTDNYPVPNIVLPEPVRLTGSVMLNGGYVAGLQVKVMSGDKVIGIYPVNEDKTFQTPALPPGTTYTLFAVYGSLSKQITAGSTVNEWTTALYSIGGTITGVTGEATVTASSASGKLQKTKSLTLSGDNPYSVGDLVPASDYIVSVTAAGMPVTYYDGQTDISKATYVNISTADKTDANFDFTSINKGTIRGNITENAAGANIGVYAFETEKFSLTQVTAVSGTYSFTLAPGNYEIFVIKANGKIFYYKDGVATQSESAATILALTATGALSGKDIDITECDNVLKGNVTYKYAFPGGDPAANVLITAASSAGKGIAVTGQDGAYTISGLCPADYRVEMNPLNAKYAVQSATVKVPPAAGGTATQNFTIDTGNVLTGKITDSADVNTPVGSAMIYLQDKQTGALVNGRMYFSSSAWDNAGNNYTIADIPYGIYTLNVTHPLYRSYSESDLEIRTDTTKDVPLVKGAYFDVTVTDGSNGDAALPGALVIVIRTGAVPVYALTGADGKCKIYGLDAVPYTVVVQKAGYDRKAVPAQTPSIDGTAVPVSLTRPAAIFALSGTITSESLPVVGAYVLVSTAAKDFFASALTDGSGMYSFTNLPQAGDYRFVVVPGGALRTQVQTNLNYATGATSFTNDVPIPSGSTISGTITAGTASIYVFLYTADSQFVGNTQADGLGGYSFTGLAVGTYKVLAVSAGFNPKWYGGTSIETATAVNAGAVNVDITLAP